MNNEVKYHDEIVYKIYDFLKTRVGSENAIPAKSLCFMFPDELCKYSVSGNDWIADVRKLRSIIREMRRSIELEKIPCSCNKGYYMSNTKDEAKKAIDRLMNAAKNEFKTAYTMAKKLGLDNQMKIQWDEFYGDTYHSLMEKEDETDKETD